jgi:ribosomal protein S27AE
MLKNEIKETCPRCYGHLFLIFASDCVSYQCGDCRSMWTAKEIETEEDRPRPEPATPPESNFL